MRRTGSEMSSGGNQSGSVEVRLTAFRLFGRDHNPAAFYSTNGLLIQGLLQIHRDYCLQMHPDCGECELMKVEKLKCGRVEK